MPYSKMSDANPAIKGIKPSVTLAQANEIAEWADNIEDADNPWAVAISQFKELYEVEGDGWVKKKIEEQDPPEICVCPECDAEAEKERGVPCRSVDCPECGVKMIAKIDEEVEEVGKRLNRTQVKRIQGAIQVLQDTLSWANYEDMVPEEEQVSEFAESASGHAMKLVEVDQAEVVPLHLEVALIEPGFGNKRDNHYYPKDVLERDAGVFAGVKMYESDHGTNKSTRLWVSTVKEIKGFTESGAPIGLVSVHDPGFATRIMALEADDLLGRMECSILANGKARKGKIDGRKAKIVEAITEADSVDWVTRAGCGGRALSLIEASTDSYDEIIKEAYRRYEL